MEQIAKEEEELQLELELELSLPSNYVTIAHLQQRWLQKKQPPPPPPPPPQEKEVRSPQLESEDGNDFQSKHATIVQLQQPCLLQQKQKKKKNRKKKTRREDAQQHHPQSNLGDDEDSKSNNCNKEEAAFSLWNPAPGKNDRKIIEPPEPHDSSQPQIEQTAAAAVLVDENLNIEEEEEENRTDFSRISKKVTSGRKPNVNQNLNGGILQLLQPEIEDDKTKLWKRKGGSRLRRRNHAVWEPKGSSKSNMAPLAENLEDLSLNAATDATAAAAAAAEIETNIPNVSVRKKNMRMNEGVSDRFQDKPKPRANPNANRRQWQNNANNLVWVKKGGDSMDGH